MKRLLLFLLAASVLTFGQTKLDLAHRVKGTLPCANMPALTGSVTSSQGSCATSGGAGSSFAGMTLGQPAVASSATGGTSSAAWLDATLFSGADMCFKVNAAYLALPSSGGTIDARGFQGAQGCNLNMYHGANKDVVLLLDGVDLISSVPQFTPQNPNLIRGGAVGNSLGTAGTVIEACGPTSTGWNGTACIVNGVTVPQFPNATNQLTFHMPHGPFPAGTYACLVCGGGQGATETAGWANDSFGHVVKDLKLDGGGNGNLFLYYSANDEERSYLDDVSYGHLGGALGNAANAAATFYDRAEASTAQSGPTHFEVRNVHLNANNTASSNSIWGLVVEGEDSTCVITGGGGSGASCFVDKVTGGTPHVVLGYPGTGYSSGPTWTVWGATATFGVTVTDCSGTATQVSGQVTSLGSQCAAVDYNNGAIGQGPEGLTATFQGNGANNIAGGVYLGGVQGPIINYLHCERMAGAGACLQLGSGSDAYSSGFFHNIDGTSTVSTTLVHLSPGGDAQQNFYGTQFTSVTGTPNIFLDETPISGITGAAITYTTADAPPFGSIRNIEFYSGGGSYVLYDNTAFPYKATASLTAGQVVKLDTANDKSVVVAATGDTGGGIVVGVVTNNPAAGSTAYVATSGPTSLPLLGTGTCTRGQFVVADTTTGGRVKCTSSYTAGTEIGVATAAQAVVGSPVTMLLQVR